MLRRARLSRHTKRSGHFDAKRAAPRDGWLNQAGSKRRAVRRAPHLPAAPRGVLIAGCVRRLSLSVERPDHSRVQPRRLAQPGGPEQPAMFTSHAHGDRLWRRRDVVELSTRALGMEVVAGLLAESVGPGRCARAAGGSILTGRLHELPGSPWHRFKLLRLAHPIPKPVQRRQSARSAALAGSVVVRRGHRNRKLH